MMRGFAAIDKSHHDDLPFPVTYDDYRPGAFQIGPRLQDMDTDGVEYSLVFPNTFVRFCGQRFLEAKDRELAMLCVRPTTTGSSRSSLATPTAASSPARSFHSGTPRLLPRKCAGTQTGVAGAVCFSEIPALVGAAVAALGRVGRVLRGVPGDGKGSRPRL